MLTQVVSDPTHETPSGVKSLIDLIFLSHPSQLVHCDVSPPLGTSDHNCIILGVSTCRTTTNSTKVIPRKIWRYSLADGILQNLDSGLWTGPWTGLWTGLVTTNTSFLRQRIINVLKVG